MNLRQPFFSRQAIAAIAVFAGLLIGVIVWDAMSFAAMQDLQAQFESKTHTLEVLRRQTGSTLVGKARTGLSDAHAAVISAPSETVAASELHKAILGVLESAGGSIHSIQAEATADVLGEGLRRLNVQITFDGPIEALQKALFNLETRIPFAFIDALSVQPAATAAPGDEPGRMLRVTLVASSYWKGLEPSSENH